jgi:hypothetical protein
MKQLNYIYNSDNELKDFIQTNKNYFNNNSKILIQLFYSNTTIEKIQNIISFLNKELNNPNIIATSTAGVVYDGDILDSGVLLSFSIFERAVVDSISFSGKSDKEILDELKGGFLKDDTKLLILFADTFKYDASSLLSDLSLIYPDIVLAGGNAGDDFKFEKCFVSSNKAISEDIVIASISSDDIDIQSDYLFNWQSIGKSMCVTKVDGSELYEVDGIPIVDIYRHYLGDDIADNILTYGIEFPIIYIKDGVEIARAAVSVDMDKKSITFAGDIPLGVDVKFGYANVNHIQQLNKQRIKDHYKNTQDSMFVYSCGSRRQMLGNFLLSELNMISSIAPSCGFITYGEFFHDQNSCTNNLLNITSTYVTISENRDKKELAVEFESDNMTKNDITLKALTTLLDKTSSELDYTIKNLEDEVSNQVEELRDKDIIINQQSKLAEIGNMIATITHQWQQPINILSIHNGTLEYQISAIDKTNGIKEYSTKVEKEIEEYLEKSKKQIDFMSQTIYDFTNFLKPIKERVVFSISDQIEQINMILKAILDTEKISITINKNMAIDTLYGYPNEFSQVLLNIINNTKDAIRSNNIDQNKREIVFNIDSKDEKIILYIQDFAGGIDDDKIDKIFDNYYSTKGEKGTGIGLFISKKIINNMGGKIKAENRDGGVIFLLEFDKIEE